MDIGANNTDCFYDTPHIDKLAATGMRFTDGYAANPVCSPTRYSLMTGKYPTRVKATNFFSGKRSENSIRSCITKWIWMRQACRNTKETRIPDIFAGKWHLGQVRNGGPKHRASISIWEDGQKGALHGKNISPFKKTQNFIQTVPKVSIYQTVLRMRPPTSFVRIRRIHFSPICPFTLTHPASGKKGFGGKI